jgi:hypothetical protein
MMGKGNVKRHGSSAIESSSGECGKSCLTIGRSRRDVVQGC